MAKALSKLISPQRAKTNAKHAQNAAYNQAQIAAQSGQPMPAMAQGMQPFSRQQMTDLKHQQNAQFNQAVQAGTQAPRTFDPAQMSQQEIASHNANMAYNESQGAAHQDPMVYQGQASQTGQQAGTALGQNMGQPVQPMQPKPPMFRQSPGVYGSRPAPQQPQRFRQSPGIYSSRPMQNATPRPTFPAATNSLNPAQTWKMRG